MPYKAFISYSHAADGKLAPALQSALHRFAKPWYQFRAMRVFRDKTSLSATPELWPTIEKALSESEFFLLMASTEAAKSSWVQKEVAWWLENRTPKTLLIVWTDGELKWMEAVGDFDWGTTTALPPNLQGAFTTEPLYVDLRWAKSEEKLSLRHTQFRAAVLDLAAPLHGKPKDELDGEDVRQHRKNKAWAWAAVMAVLAFGITAGWEAKVATQERDKAKQAAQAEREARIDADEKRKEAERATKAEKEAKDQAEARRKEAEHQRQIAEEQRRVASSRQLAAQARNHLDLDRRLDLALLLSLEANRYIQTIEAKASLLTALQSEPRVICFLQTDAVGVNSIAFSPDVRTLAVDHILGIDLWDVNSCRSLGPTLRIFINFGDIVTFSPNGQLLVAATRSPDGIIMWDAATRERLGRLNAWGHWGTCVAFSPDGKTLASGGNDGSIILWDVDSHRPIGPLLTGHTSEVRTVAFSQDGKTLASVGREGDVILWDMHGPLVLSRPLTHQVGGVRSAVFGQAGSILTWNSSGIVFWDAATGHQLGQPLPTQQLDVTSLDLSPDGKTLATGSSDGSITLWDAIKREQIIASLSDHPSKTVETIALSPDGKTLASAHYGGIILWDLRGSRTLGQLLTDQAEDVFTLALSPAGKILAVGSGNRIMLWDMATRQQLDPPLTGHDNGVTSLAFSPDGKRLASGGDDNRVIIWDLTTHQPVAPPLTGHESAVANVVFISNGRTLASVSNQRLTLWDLTTLNPVDLFLPRDKKVGAILSSDGKVLARIDGVRIFISDPSTQKTLVLPLPVPRRSLALSSDGKMYAEELYGRFSLKDTANQQELQSLSGDTLNISAMAFSPDDKILAMGKSSGHIILWDVASGQSIATLAGHEGEVTALAFISDTKILLSSGSDKRIILWDLGLESLKDQSCRIANRDLTIKEWKQYLGDEPYRKTCPNLP